MIRFNSTVNVCLSIIYEVPTYSLASGSSEKGIELADVKFHQCVRLTRFELDRVITFVPPDGDFELLSYRLNINVRKVIVIILMHLLD